jgi:hypothetical protein
LIKLSETITEAEDRWQAPLYNHCRKLFSGIFLPSHDHVHHARVWSHARSLLLSIDSAGMTVPEELPEQLLISCFFHDVGLIRTPGEQHGKESRRLCEEYFSYPGSGGLLPDKASIGTILEAIEHHDDKTLKSTPDNGTAQGPGYAPDLLTLLSTADDLDAFGLMGIYRYAEIYLMRGIKAEQLPRRVSSNVSDRFENIRSSFGQLEEFMKTHEPRFRQVHDFYLRLGQAYASTGERDSWEPELIGIFRESIMRKENLLLPERVLPASTRDERIFEWFNALDRDHFT